MKSSEVLLIIRQNIVSWLKKYEYIIIPLAKFIIAFSITNIFKLLVGYHGGIGASLMPLVLGLLSIVVSSQTIIILTILIVTLFFISSNFILGIMIFIILSLIYILYSRLFPNESLLIIITLVAFALHIEMLVPIIAGLLASYASIVAIIIGIILWYMVPTLAQLLSTIVINKEELLESVNKLLEMDYKSLLINQEMLIVCVIFFIVFTTIYCIKRLGIDYGPYIAIGIGAIMNILGFVLAKFFFQQLQLTLLPIILCTIIFAFIATIVQFMSIALDYQGAEVVNFEDDDNFYFVKIVPKIKIIQQSKTIKQVYTEEEQESLDKNYL